MRAPTPSAGADDELGPRPMTAIVFRRLRSPSEHAVAEQLLADGGAAPLPAPLPSGTVLFGWRTSPS